MATAKRPARRRHLWRKDWPQHPQLSAETWITIPFQDADPTGVAWHGNYFRYYDSARVLLLDKLDFGYRQMAEQGQIWPIVETKVNYLNSLAFDARVRVCATLVEWEFRLRIYYQIFDEAGASVNEAYTVQVPVDARSNSLIVGVPTDLQQRIAALLAEPGTDHD